MTNQYSDEAQYKATIRSLTNIPPSPETIETIESFRAVAKTMAAAIIEMVPQGRERSLALTKLEELVMWGVKGLVLHADLGGPH